MKKEFIVFSFIFLFLSNILAWLVVSDLSKPALLRVVFFDVGQGDAIFIETPKRHQILIDGGPNSSILEKLSKEMPFWDRTIDLVILTHPERDHLFGLLDVLKRYKIENILWTGIIREIPEYEKWKELIEKEKSEIKIAKAGLKIFASDFSMKILYPFENLEGKKYQNSNETSIVSKLIFDKISFLFTGDILKKQEKELIDQYSDFLESNILKLAHHGSKSSNSEEFLREVLPEIAIISVGRENKYGHPHQEVLERLEKYDIKILRTDRDKDIKIISNGKKYEFSHL
jgi:competence protein ComEC